MTIGARVDRKGEFIISVVDTGVGMIGKGIGLALSRYRRIDNAATGPCQGAGLGLPLTKALVECYGGCLELQSDLGVGTIAAVHFPASRIERTEPDAAAAAAAAAAAWFPSGPSTPALHQGACRRPISLHLVLWGPHEAKRDEV